MTTFFTSDHHFHHDNVIRYTDRPWAFDGVRHMLPSEMLGRPVGEVPYEELKRSVRVDVRAMNEEMTRRWNSVVGPDDEVYHLGDFAMGQKHLLAGTVSRLNGRKTLVLGNHDRSANTMRSAGFERVFQTFTLDVSGARFLLSHRPIRWGWEHLADFHLCGHVHERWRRRGNVINVGVDRWDFTPRTLDAILSAPDEGPFTSDEDVR